MPFPTVDDDGDFVTLDLHGATVDQAMKLTRRVLREAYRRGRDRVKIIHGSSTSNPQTGSRTIKHELYKMLDRGTTGTAITADLRSEGHLILSLPISEDTDRRPITILDVTR